MLLLFDIKYYERVYNTLINKLDFPQDIFETNDVIKIDKEDYNKIITALPDIKFSVS